jgi:hypothetical protein
MVTDIYRILVCGFVESRFHGNGVGTPKTRDNINNLMGFLDAFKASAAAVTGMRRKPSSHPKNIAEVAGASGV